MPKAIQGADLLLFFRKLKDAATESGAKLAFQTEHSLDKSKDNESTSTKDGTVNTPGSDENTVSISSLAYVNDDNVQAMWEDLEEWYDAGEIVEVWEANRNRKVGELYKARYFQGTITSFSLSAPSDGVVELEMEYAVNGSGTKGEMALSDAQQEVAQYAFTDLAPKVEV